MAGANNKQLKSAGFKAAAIRTIRISAGRGLSIKSAIGHAQDYGLAVPAKAVQKAGTSGAPEGWKAAAARVAAMKSARSGPPPGWVKAAQGKAPSERQTDVSNLNAAFRANRPTLPADVKVRPKFTRERHVERLKATRNAINDKAAGLSDKLAKIRNAIRASEDEKRRNLDAKAPEFADFRGKNRADRAQKFAKARKVWERPWRRIERLTRLEASGRQQIEKLFARGDRLTAAINRMGG